jgi:hypothetical protein
MTRRTRGIYSYIEREEEEEFGELGRREVLEENYL